jgi:hypothetical protein
MMADFSFPLEFKQFTNSHLLISAKQLLIAAGVNTGAINANGYALALPT